MFGLCLSLTYKDEKLYPIVGIPVTREHEGEEDLACLLTPMKSPMPPLALPARNIWNAKDLWNELDLPK